MHEGNYATFCRIPKSFTPFPFSWRKKKLSYASTKSNTSFPQVQQRKKCISSKKTTVFSDKKVIPSTHCVFCRENVSSTLPNENLTESLEFYVSTKKKLRLNQIRLHNYTGLNPDLRIEVFKDKI